MAVIAVELFSLSTVYAFCFWLGLIFAVISGLMSGVFHGSHADSPHLGGAESADGGHGGDVGGDGGHGMPDFPAVGPVTISTFVTIFGGLGIIFSNIPATNPVYFSLPMAMLSGLGGAYGVFLLFSRVIYAQQSSSEVQQYSLLGQRGTVITTIPAAGCGEIVFEAGAGRQNAQARTESGEAIPSGSEVTITKVVGGCYYVKRVTKEERT